MRRYRLIHQIGLLCALSLCAAQSWSHAKTDLITVANGDQITGAVNAMSAGKLSVSTSYAGTVNIKWREIKQIESRYLYEIRLDDGERIYGRFITNTTENQLTLRVSSQNRQIDIDDVVEVRSIEEELADKLTNKLLHQSLEQIKRPVQSKANSKVSVDKDTNTHSKIES